MFRDYDAVKVAWENLVRKNIKQSRYSLKGSADSLQAQLDEAVQKYGAIPAGAKPARDIQVPKKATDNKNERISQTVRMVLEAKATPDEMLPTIEEMALEGKFSYEVLSDKKAITDAEATIQNKGWTSSLSEWLQKTANGSVNKKIRLWGGHSTIRQQTAVILKLPLPFWNIWCFIREMRRRRYRLPES